jgi:hypothetical protein
LKILGLKHSVDVEEHSGAVGKFGTIGIPQKRGKRSDEKLRGSDGLKEAERSDGRIRISEGFEIRMRDCTIFERIPTKKINFLVLSAHCNELLKMITMPENHGQVHKGSR